MKMIVNALPGGRLAVPDVVTTTELPDNIKSDMALHSRCMAGASPISEIESMLDRAGFENVRIKLNAASREFVRDWLPGSGIEDYLVSAEMEAVKPG